MQRKFIKLKQVFRRNHGIQFQDVFAIERLYFTYEPIRDTCDKKLFCDMCLVNKATDDWSDLRSRGDPALHKGKICVRVVH
jgi:hypothetical protein